MIDRGVFDLCERRSDPARRQDSHCGYVAPFGEDVNIMLNRLNTDGSLDASFDSDGTAIVSGLTSDRAYAMAIQPDGKIVAVGQAFNGSNMDIAVVRFNSDGSPDASFDADGKLRLQS